MIHRSSQLPARFLLILLAVCLLLIAVLLLEQTHLPALAQSTMAVVN